MPLPAHPAMLVLLFTTLTVAIAALTLLPLSRSEQWWVRSLDFPRLQLFLLAFGLLVAEVLLLGTQSSATRLLLIVGAACVICHGWWIVPYTPLFAREVQPAAAGTAPRLRMMVANVLASNRDAAALLRLVEQHRPDVLVTLESDAWWQAQLDTLQPGYPHAIKCPRDNRYGMHVYSRLRLEQATIDYLVQDDVPSIHARLMLRTGDAVQTHFLHPAPPSPTEKDSSSQRDAELVMVARRVAKQCEPTIVTGDLNDVAWSRTTRLFRKISGLLDPRVGRGMFNTFHAGHWWLRWPLDHLFHSAHFRLASLARLPPIGSDHFPLLTELVLCGDVQSAQSGLDADAEDQRHARQKVANEDVGRGDVPRMSARQ